ncbi:MAG: ABC transporter substrate-binding protein [Candidatus Poribacteria bacterium]|nr:ABC transporter substrate-binding protein [Candidatus Poribacteria bacterium]
MNVGRIILITFVLPIITLIVGLSGCGESLDDSPQTTGIAGEIRIGVVLALTGQFADELGKPMQNGFELARAEINSSGQLGDAKIRFITEDDQSVSAVEAFNKLIHEDGVSVITGLAVSTQAKEAFPIAQENRVVAFSPVSTAPGLSAIGDYIFRASLTVDELNSNGVKITQEILGYKRAATIYDETDLFSTNSNEAFLDALAEHGVEVLTTQTIQTGNTDFSVQLTLIKETNPDAIFCTALPKEIPLILTQGRDLGIPNLVPFIIPQLSQALVQGAGPAAEGAISLIAWSSIKPTPGNGAFVQNYRAAYGTEPNAWAAQSYAVLYILAAAIADAQSTDSTAIRDALANTINFDTILGQFSFDAVGDAVYDPQVLIFKNGEFKAFE